MKRVAGSLMVFAFAAAGCTASLGAEGTIEGRQLWLCDSQADRVTCTAPIPAGANESGAYACQGGEEGFGCPPESAVAGLREELEGLGEWGSFAEEPWACLLTGAHQRHCSKILQGAWENVDPDDDLASEDVLDEAVPEVSGELGDARNVIRPDDCAVASWEEFFCDHASRSYQDNGVDLAFPCDVFDAGADFLDLAIEAGSLPAGVDGLPSCQDGEWAMREGAWLEAVMAGCMGLSEEILVWCQQGANHAARAAKCNATGTW